MIGFIASACRSPVAPRGGALSALALHELAAPVINAALREAGLTSQDVDEVILSNALGGGGNPARIAALAAGLPEQVAGLSMDRQCAGGLDAILLAAMMVQSGHADVVVAGGAESYSRRPLRHQTFADGRAPEPYDQAPFTPWPDRDPDMAVAAAALARSHGISRQAQDDWALASHAKALARPARSSEVIPIAGLQSDSFARALSPALCKRAKVISGDITAANAAVAADGAAFCVVVSQKVAARLASPLVRVIGGATRGGPPECPGLAPVAAIQTSLARHGLSAAEIDAAEIMEAYAVQAIACVQGAGLDPAQANRGGGALARGHPIGASGAINAVRLYHELIQSGGGTGLAAIAAAGGLGTALLLGT
ncbi:thiolase family protein [Sulfitobacter mediterraneus]|uniref:Acetyl-CoA acetyltransferase n=1 Tax=Sulfitobacter mediterraneus TaxID=83219 RepID=A0A061SU56_9RHOB|nr:thiolase family protein [Sulfitobacter mediterraneus]KAJ04482.1 acetyl-CoA acetyltransferase [Sulfitobacter mediterraneus]